MKAIILAAGKGSRLYPVTHHIPKPLLPIAGKPILVHAIETIRSMGISELCIIRSTDHAYMEKQLEDYFNSSVNLSFEIQTEQKGLAHALLSAKNWAGKDDFILYLGDAMYDGDLTPFHQTFVEKCADNMNLVKTVSDPQRYGIAILNGDKISDLEEKPGNPRSNLAMAGLYWFNAHIWEIIDNLKPGFRGEYEITDAICELINAKKDVRAAVYNGKWFDTGTLDSYLEANNYFLNGNSIIDTEEITCDIGENVYIGRNVTLSCKSISNAVILDGACIQVNGHISHCLLGGMVKSERSIYKEILYHFSGKYACNA